MHFGGDCYGDMTRLPPLRTEDKLASADWVAPQTELLVMGAIHHTGAAVGIGGRSDFRVHRSADGGNSWTLVARVYNGSASYSGITALNSTHVGVVFNAGSKYKPSMDCDAMTKYRAICARCNGERRYY